MSTIYDGLRGAFREIDSISAISQLNFVRLASTVNISATYDSGAKTLTATAVGRLTLDGTDVVNTNRVLMKNQANRAHNGIFDVTVQGDNSTAFVLTRSSDMADDNDLESREVIVITEGSANKSTGLQLINTGDIQLGVTGLRFNQFTEGVTGVSAEGLEAIELAASPSASNVFATMADLAQPAYDWANPGLAQSGDELNGFALVNWPDASAAGAATSCTATLLEGGRILRVDARLDGTGTPVTGSRAQGRLRAVAEGDWIYAFRFSVSVVNDNGTYVPINTSLSSLFAQIVFVDGASAATAPWFGLGYVVEASNERYGFKWLTLRNTVSEAPGDVARFSTYTNYDYKTTAGADGLSAPNAPVDIIIQRSGTTLHRWICQARGTPLYAETGITVTAGAGFIGPRLQSISQTKTFRMNLLAFRKMSALPF